MDEDIIEAIADALYKAKEDLASSIDSTPEYAGVYVAYHKIVEEIGLAVNSLNPTYDMRYFYKAAGYQDLYPYHELR